MTASVLMVQGCASSVGKSLLTTGLCRLYRRRGLSVAPFKAQNMALNSYVTLDGGEIGRSQAVQAQAAGIEPTVDMNPILLKPEGNGRCQVIVLGKPLARLSAMEQGAKKRELAGIVAESLGRLREQHDLVIIEGAGSPAEINLREKDIVNMHVARMAKAPVLLVGDIDHGGVFAHFAGTLQLLEPEDRATVAGLIINKFRGDLKLLEPGIEMIEERVGVPVMGVVPYIKSLQIAEEDSVSLDLRRGTRRSREGELEIAVVRFPLISNFDDFLALEHEAGVVVRYVEEACELEDADLVILPGTKGTRADLAWLRERGMDKVVIERAVRGRPVLGICGGFQMLGRSIDDPAGLESSAGRDEGLGLLPIHTQLHSPKTTRRRNVTAEEGRASTLTSGLASQDLLSCYEIHMGSVQLEPEAQSLFVDPESGERDGAWAGSVSGTLFHGILQNASVRRALLNSLRGGGKSAAVGKSTVNPALAEYDRVADTLEKHLQMDRIDSLLKQQHGLVAGVMELLL